MNDDPLMPELPRLPLDPEFRERVRAESTRRLPRPARRRVAAVALAASLLIASLIAWRLMSRPTEPAPTPPEPRIATAPKEPERKTDAEAVLAGAIEMEWKAFDSRKPERAKLYQAAGDRYVLEQDYAAALRCYREVLDAGGPAVEVSSNDNWLVMALKLDRNKEN